jgi:Putative phage tail protein
MKATLITCRDPFRPQQSREIVPLRRRRRLRALAPRTSQPHVCLLNGRPVLRAEWGRKVRDGDVVAFVVLPQGGGSNPMRLIASLVLLYVAVQFGPGAGAALGFTGNAATAIGTSLIMTGGNILINAVIPPPRLDMGGWGNAQAASPTYSLSASGNQARLGGPIPVIYGRHLVYPDFAAQPYVEYGGNEQYLYQLHVIGQGQYEIEAIRIEDTPVSSFEEIEYQVVQPGQSVTLFPTQVTTSIEVSGQELLQSQTLGPFVANASATLANVIGVDIIAPRGLYYAEDSGSLSVRSATWTVEARTIDGDGNPVGSWALLGSETLSAATTTPQRVSYRYGVTPGRYEVRATRTNAKLTGTRESNEIAWGSLRAYLVGGNSYGDLTLLALRMRSSNNLSSLASRKINAIVTRKLPTWNGSAWTAPVATANPAWALADIARASYGAGLDDSRIDLDGLQALAAEWAARGDECNLVFDSTSTIWQALQTVARTGRAFPFLQGGILRVYRDAPQALPAGMFSPRNMVRNSFKLSYKMPSEEMADAVDVEYFDRLSWSWKTVRAALPDSPALQPVKLKLPGVTSRAQAWREGMYMAACNRYRRRFVSFSTEMEGFIPSLGDLVTVTHDMPQWGQSSEVVAFDPATATVTLMDAVAFTTGPHYLTWRDRAGRPVGPFQAFATASAHVVQIGGFDPLLDSAPDTGPQRERSHAAFGPAQAQYVQAKVLGITPRSASSVDLSLVVDSDYVYQADTGAVPGAGAWQLPLADTAPRVSGLLARSMPSDIGQMVISWAPSPGAERYLVEVSADGSTWTRVGETTANSYLGPALYGSATLIRVAAVGITRGPWNQASYGSSAGYMWSAAAATPMWTLNTNPMWSA